MTRLRYFFFALTLTVIVVTGCSSGGQMYSQRLNTAHIDSSGATPEEVRGALLQQGYGIDSYTSTRMLTNRKPGLVGPSYRLIVVRSDGRYSLYAIRHGARISTETGKFSLQWMQVEDVAKQVHQEIGGRLTFTYVQ